MTVEARVRAARDLHRFLGSTQVSRSPGAFAAAVDSLGAVLSYDCATLLEWDGAAQRHAAIVNHAYPTYCVRHWESQVHHEPSFLRMQLGAPVLRVGDIPPHERVNELFDETFDRPGFGAGLALRLWARDGRFLGSVIANAVGPAPFDDLAVDLVEMIAPRLAAVLDPLAGIGPETTDLVDGRADGLIVDRAGRVRRLTDGADADLVRRGGPLRPMVSAVASGRSPVREAIALVSGRVLSVSVHAGKHGVLVLHRTVPPPFGLSVRELEILDALADGATNAHLATRFGIAARTVATYVERILVKTGCPNRTAAARLATRLTLTVC